MDCTSTNATCNDTTVNVIAEVAFPYDCWKSGALTSKMRFAQTFDDLSPGCLFEEPALGYDRLFARSLQDRYLRHLDQKCHSKSCSSIAHFPTVVL